MVLVLAALFAWWVKGDLEMAWLYAGPAIVGVTLVLAALGSVALPRGFPRAGAVLTALPIGLLIAWVAASTTNTWPVPPDAAWLEEGRRIAGGLPRLETEARTALDAPVEVAGAFVDSADGFARKVSGRLGLEHRAPSVSITVPFDVGPRAPLRLALDRDGQLTPIEPLPDVRATVVRIAAVLRRYPDLPFMEFGGQGPYPPGTLVALRLLRGEMDWEIAIVQVLGADEPLAEVRRITREELRRGLDSALAAAGARASAFRTHFQPAGDRILFFPGSRFDFQALLEGGGIAGMRASLEGDSIAYEVVTLRR